MTLSPVFRSDEAVQVLRTAGVWRRLEPAGRGQAEAIARVKEDLPHVLDTTYIQVDQSVADPEKVPLEFVQEFFFLILFRSVLETVGVTTADLRLCCELNFCIKGTITAADNLFDDQDKALLPLRLGHGARFRSILQLLAFEHLVSLALERGRSAGSISAASADQFQRELLSRMAAIGSLEGSEEGGVDGVMEPEAMIEQVHRVRGGALFELAFIAPRLLTTTIDPRLLSSAQSAISKLGTAFQIVDDLTDFEFDLTRGSHNLLVSQITHRGSRAERARLADWRGAAPSNTDVVAEMFAESARAVVAIGENEATTALRELQSLGFWFPAELSHELVRAIVGIDGVSRMRSL